MLKNGEVLEISKMYNVEGNNDVKDIIVFGKKLKIIESDINYPCNLCDLKIFKVQLPAVENSEKTMLTNVHCKMMLITIYELPEDDKESWVVPLLHMNGC